MGAAPATRQKATRHSAPKPAANATTGLLQVAVNDRPLRDVTTEALAALVVGNSPPTVFARSGSLARVVCDENGAPTIIALTESALRGVLARRADFVRVTYGRGSDSNRVTQVAPPLDVVRDVAALGEWPLPPLAGIIEAPTMRPDGSILSKPGYDATTGLCYAPAADFDAPVIPDRPDARAVAQSADLLAEVFCDMPYDGQASRANAIAALVTPVLRSLIDGPVPLFLFDKPQAGSGGSLQAEVVSMVATGRASAMLTAPRDDEGWRKAITSLLLEIGRAHV